MKTRLRQSVKRERYARGFSASRREDLRSRGWEASPQRRSTEVADRVRTLESERVDLKDFFAAAEAREDHWQQLNSLAQAWRRSANEEEGGRSRTDEHLLRKEAIDQDLGLNLFGATERPRQLGVR